MPRRPTLVYGTCVALGPVAALLQGPSASGKSDLALRFVHAFSASPDDARLVADDQVHVSAEDDRLIARAPALLAGKLELRGIGIIAHPYVAEAELRLVIRLTDAADIPRMPPATLPTVEIAGFQLPALALAPFEASAPLKLRWAFAQFVR